LLNHKSSLLRDISDKNKTIISVKRMMLEKLNTITNREVSIYWKVKTAVKKNIKTSQGTRPSRIDGAGSARAALSSMIVSAAPEMTAPSMCPNF
jgi:hypothetical protein